MADHFNNERRTDAGSNEVFNGTNNSGGPGQRVDASVEPMDSMDPKAPVANPDNIDLSKLSPQELKLYKLYGRLPGKKDIFQHKLQERKYFDSGDYALSRAGVRSDDLQSSPIANNNLPLTNPSGLRESIIRRRMSNSASSVSNVDPQRMSRQGSISSGPPPRSPNK